VTDTPPTQSTGSPLSLRERGTGGEVTSPTSDPGPSSPPGRGGQGERSARASGSPVTIAIAAGAILALFEMAAGLIQGTAPGGAATALWILGLLAGDLLFGLCCGLGWSVLAWSWRASARASAAARAGASWPRRLLSNRRDPDAATLLAGGALALALFLTGAYLLIHGFATLFVNQQLAALVCLASLLALAAACVLVAPLLAAVARPLLGGLDRLMPRALSSLSLRGVTLLAGLAALAVLAAAAWHGRVALLIVPKRWALALLVFIAAALLFCRGVRQRPAGRRSAIVAAALTAALLLAAALTLPLRQSALRALYDHSDVAGRVMFALRPLLSRSAPVDPGQRFEDAPPVLPPPPADQPLPDAIPRGLSLLLLTIDALRADHVHAYGHHRETTPNLDRLASEGVLFENAFANAPLTRWAVPLIMTSRYPPHIAWDLSRYPNPVKPENLCLAEILGQAGFGTAALLNFFIFDPRWGMNQGFELYDNSASKLHPRAETRTFSSHVMTDRAIEYLGSVGDERFFLWVHYLDPHRVYVDHAEAPDWGDTAIDRYDKEIFYTDRHVGRLLDWMRERGLLERTVVVMLADHGEAFNEHGFTDHGYSLYNEEIRVPLVLRAPDLTPRRIRQPVAHIDLAPTLLNLLRVPIPRERFMGRNLVPQLLGGPEDLERQVFLEVYYGRRAPQRSWGVVDLRYKMIYDETANLWALYDQVDDRGEKHDLYEERPEVAARYGERLRGFMNQARHPDWESGRSENLLTEMPATARPLEARFGDRLMLHGVELRPEAVRPGGQAELTLYFSALEPVEESYRVFVHAEGRNERGRQRFLADHLPAKGLLPTYRWQPGQIVRDRIELSTKGRHAGAEFTVYVGLYQKKPGSKRLPVGGEAERDAHDRVIAGKLRVLK